jgi:murein DD-endopeptidase MepM/ murein hydrolase activator NlpD
MPNIEVRMSGLPYTFTTVLSGTITLAANDGGTSCNIKLADVDRAIGDALVAHSIASGGIQGILQPKATEATGSTNVPVLSTEANAVPLDPGKSASYTQSWATIELLIVKECLAQGVVQPDQIAYVLATAAGETGKGRDLVEVWDGKGAQATYDGRLGNTNPGDGYKYRGRGFCQLTGKERYIYWGKRLGIDLVANPDRLAALDVAIPVLVSGMVDGQFTGRKLSTYINNSGTDFYNARRVINGIVPDQVPIYLNLAAYYKTKVAGLITLARANPKVVPKQAASNSISKTTPVAPAAIPEEPILRGNKLFINWYDIALEFFHTGTELNSDGSTTLTGQGLRWVLNRRKRTKALKGITFSQLAAQVGRNHGITVEYQAAFDPSFIVIEQTGISDYALLKREASRAGLYISEQPGKIVIQSLSQIKDTTILLQPGLNLLKWVIRDKAIDPDATYTQPDSSLTTEVKGAIDPLTGKLVQKVPDVDPTKSTKDVTGSTPSKAPMQGVLNPGQEVKALQQVQRLKRVKGLPSTFTVATDSFYLSLTPLSALRTKGISKYLDRVWLIDKLTHSSDGTTVLDCFSPVDIIDVTPVTPVTSLSGLAVDAPPGAFVVPTSGTVTSLVGKRSAPKAGASTNHKGTDIANSTGTEVRASNDGVVTFSGTQSGYGYIVIIQHSGGYETRYAHLSKLIARLDGTVKRGDLIGLMGNTGNGTGTHLHFEIRKDGGTTVLTPSAVGLNSLTRLTNTVIVGSTT